MDLPLSQIETLCFAAHNNPARAWQLNADDTQNLMEAGLLIQNPKQTPYQETTFAVTRKGQRVLNDSKQ